MFVPRKTHPFGNKYNTIAFAKSKVIYNIEIVEGKDQIIVMGEKDFEKKGETAGLMVRMTKPLWGIGKVLVTECGFYVLEGTISMVEKGVLGSALIKKRRYWYKGVTPEDILWHMQKMEVGDVDSVQGSIRGNSYNIIVEFHTVYSVCITWKL